ncbi:hypothetical protein [Paenibacillus chitinolyticus]|uniref:hypothetical protein n=1 Tax=Paenibacillus chitinolyticus TaxID=79263 RepID=UPI00363503E3
MKKYLVMLGMVLILVACNSPKETTASYITVVDKGSTNDNQHWITVKKSDNKEFKILIKEKNTWNLIEQGKDYFASYSTNESRESTLDSIDYPGSNMNESKK